MLQSAEETSGFLKAISHPSRLVILCRLSESPATVGELEAFAGLPQAEVSKHLARLREDALVVARRDGRNVTYSLADPRTLRIVHVLHTEFCASQLP